MNIDDISKEDLIRDKIYFINKNGEMVLNVVAESYLKKIFSPIIFGSK